MTLSNVTNLMPFSSSQDTASTDKECFHMRTHVYMMQKNEGELLRDWIEYYVRLFGLDALTIFDNDSTDPHTLDILATAVRRGLRVVTVFKSRHDFDNKGDIIARLAELDMSNDHDLRYILPTDCDERLAVLTDTGISQDPALIHAELFRNLDHKGAIRIDMSMMNVPGSANWFCPKPPFCKSMLPALPIEKIDAGFHFCKSAADPHTRISRLTYLHFHNPSYQQAHAKARQKLGPCFNYDDHKSLNEQLPVHSPGAHLVPLLTMSEAEYNARYDQELRITATTPLQFKIPGSDEVHTWDADIYLRKNPDVQSRHTQGPLHHFLRYGFEENRLFK